ncbi:hypothetical protein [Streptomyces macrosporus]
MAGAFLTTDGTADAAPRDPCSLVASEELRRIVPLARVTHRATPRHEVRNEAECEATSGDGWVEKGRYGRLSVDLERHGTTRFGSGWEEARDSFDRSREYAAGDGSAPRKVPGLGEEAFAEARFETSGARAENRAEADVTVLLGRDVLTVRYTAEPSSPERARRVAVAVARTLLEKL